MAVAQRTPIMMGSAFKSSSAFPRIQIYSDGRMESLTRIGAFFLQLLQPNQLEALLLSWGWLGYPILFAIVFAETGLLVGFFFPGDSLLFIAGFVASRGVLDIYGLNLLLMTAAIAGDATGYFLGRKTGPKIFTREDSFLFKKSHLKRTHEFYERHGGKTIVLARFVPIIRTFAPFVAGVGEMSYRRFAFYNVFGGIGWVLLTTAAGYLLGNVPIIKKNFEVTILLIIVLSILPIFWEVVIARLKKRPNDK
jgi:membrane-associated protein